MCQFPCKLHWSKLSPCLPACNHHIPMHLLLWKYFILYVWFFAFLLFFPFACMDHWFVIWFVNTYTSLSLSELGMVYNENSTEFQFVINKNWIGNTLVFFLYLCIHIHAFKLYILFMCVTFQCVISKGQRLTCILHFRTSFIYYFIIWVCILSLHLYTLNYTHLKSLSRFFSYVIDHHIDISGFVSFQNWNLYSNIW